MELLISDFFILYGLLLLAEMKLATELFSTAFLKIKSKEMDF